VTIFKVTIDCRACCIFLLDPADWATRLEASSGLPEERRASAQLRTDRGIGGRVFQRTAIDPLPDALSMGEPGYFDPESTRCWRYADRSQSGDRLLSLDDTRNSALPTRYGC